MDVGSYQPKVHTARSAFGAMGCKREPAAGILSEAKDPAEPDRV